MITELRGAGLKFYQQLFSEMEALCELHLVDILAISREEVKKGAYHDKLRQFADGLKTA